MSRFASLVEFAMLFEGPPVRTAEGLLVRCPTHDDAKQSLSLGQKGNKLLAHCFAGCETETAMAAVNVEMKDLFLDDDGLPSSRGSGLPGQGDAGRSGSTSPRPAGPRGSSRPPGKIVQAYDYKDEAGVLLYQAVRFEPKAFVRRRPNGKGGWTWSLDPAGRRVLYRLNEL